MVAGPQTRESHNQASGSELEGQGLRVAQQMNTLNFVHNPCLIFSLYEVMGF